jgi:hypothetical protein
MLELGVDDLRSKAEHALRHWLRQAGLPLPLFNAEVGPWAHDRDHRKEQYLLGAGYATRRFTALQAIDEPVLVIAGIAAALAQNR